MKKTLKLVTLATTFCVLMGITANATYVCNDYDGRIKAYHANTRFEFALRSTNQTANPWRVAIRESGEGKGTITTFWLEDFYGNNVSADINVKYDGYSEYYASPYSTANGIDVYLTAENNNYNAASYNLRGYWSEEDIK